MISCLKSSLVLLIWSTLFFAVGGDVACAQQEANENDRELVTEIAPGIKRYGQIPKLIEVGQSYLFEVAPDGETLVFCSSKKLKFWDIESNKVRLTESLKIQAQSMRYSSDGLQLLLTGWDSKTNSSVLSVHDAITAKFIKQINPGDFIEKGTAQESNLVDQEGRAVKQPFHIQTWAVNQENDNVAFCGGQQTVIIDIEKEEKVSSLAKTTWTNSVAFSRDGEKLLTNHGSCFDVRTGEEEKEMFKDKGTIVQYSTVTTNPKHNVIAAGHWSGALTIFDFEKERKYTIEQPTKKQTNIFQLEFSGDGKLLAAVARSTQQDQEQEIIVWDWKSKKIKTRFPIQRGNVVALRFSLDDESVFTKFSNTIGVSKWSLAEKDAKKRTVSRSNIPIRTLKFSSDGEMVTTLGLTGTGTVIDLESGEPIHEIACTNGTQIAISPDDRFTVLAANYQLLTIFDRKSKKSKNLIVQSFRRPSLVSQFRNMLSSSGPGSWENLVISNVETADDDEHLLVALRGQKSFVLATYGLKSGEIKAQKKFKMKKFWTTNNVDPSRLQWRFNTFVASPDQENIAIISDNNELLLIDVESKTIVHDLGKLVGSTFLKFSHDGTRLITSAEKLKIWDVESGQEIEGDFASAGLKFDIDAESKRLVTLNQNREVKLFDLESGDEQFQKKVDFKPSSICISPEGNKLAIGMDTTQFEVWDLDELMK